MQPTDPNSKSGPSGPSYPILPIILTFVLMAGWVVMWAIGLFRSLGPTITGVILLGDLAGAALIWFLWANGKWGGKR